MVHVYDPAVCYRMDKLHGLYLGENAIFCLGGLLIHGHEPASLTRMDTVLYI